MLKDYLKNRDISIYALSKDTNIAYSTLNDLCNNKTNVDNCSIGVFIKISNYLNISIEELYSYCLIDEYYEKYKSNIYIKRKKYFITFDCDDEIVDLELCSVNDDNNKYLRTIVNWTIQDYFDSKEMDKQYKLLLHNTKKKRH